MGFLFKKTRYSTDKIGRRIKKQSRKWRIRYRDSKDRLREVTGFTDKEASRQLLAQLEREAALERVGLSDPYKKHMQRPLVEHLEDYKQFLNDKGNTRKHCRATYQSIKRSLDECKFRCWQDLLPSRFLNHLNELRRAGRSARTYNTYLVAMKGFSAWLVKDRRVPDDPLLHLARIPEDGDRRIIRRALTEEEFVRLLVAAGSQRADIYVFAAYTGLRAGEIGRVTRDRISFEPTPTLTTEALCKKRHKKDILPLHPCVVERIRSWVEKLTPKALLWPGNWWQRAAEMLREDLTKAKIPFEDESGLRFDFHALRGQFATALARSGVPLQEAQALLRHSYPKLTSNVYTHLTLKDHKKAIEKLKTPEE